jgi:hypothetical protein
MDWRGADMTIEPRSCVSCGEEHDEPAIPDRVHALALDILHRIRPVCSHMPDEELLSLATRMASVELRHFMNVADRAPVRRHIARG